MMAYRQPSQNQQVQPLYAGAAATVPRSKYLADALADLQRTPQIQSYGQLGTELLAEALNQRTAQKAENEVQGRTDMKDHQRQALINTLFAGNPEMAAAAGIDPSAALGAFFKSQEPQKLSQGETLLTGGQPTYTAPTYGQVDGRGYTLGPNGMQQLGELAPSQAQVWNQDNANRDFGLRQDQFGYQQSHDARVNDPIAFGQLNVGRQNAQASMMGAGASQQNAATNRASYEARLKQGGFGTPGAGPAVLGAELPPGWVPQ